MKAVMCNSYGPPENLVLEDIPDLEPDADEAVVEVHSASLNFADGLQIQGKYLFQPHMPFTPGSDVGGVIKSVGADFTALEIGAQNRVQKPSQILYAKGPARKCGCDQRRALQREIQKKKSRRRTGWLSLQGRLEVHRSASLREH